jgi:hypothetical protein
MLRTMVKGSLWRIVQRVGERRVHVGTAVDGRVGRDSRSGYVSRKREEGGEGLQASDRRMKATMPSSRQRI